MNVKVDFKDVSVSDSVRRYRYRTNYGIIIPAIVDMVREGKSIVYKDFESNPDIERLKCIVNGGR